MKQFLVGMALGATVTGTGALAVDMAKGSGNPIENLPLQTQVNLIIDSVDKQFDNVSAGFARVQEIVLDIDRRLTALEQKK